MNEELPERTAFDDFIDKAVAHYQLDTVEKFYEYMGQANMFKPPFARLAPDTQEMWRKDFEAAIRRTGG